MPGNGLCRAERPLVRLFAYPLSRLLILELATLENIATSAD